MHREWRRGWHGVSTRLYGPDPANGVLDWIAEERLAIGPLPTASTFDRLAAEGVTHVVNCRAHPQVLISQDLAVERAVFGADRVVHAPLWDSGRPQPPRLWAAAALVAADALDGDPQSRVFVHCQQGRRRSLMLGYAVLRLRGHGAVDAAALVTTHRPQGELVPAYAASVEGWLASR
jgi:protein-tyrosine phosphatase